jgi:hypothetical protein
VASNLVARSREELDSGSDCQHIKGPRKPSEETTATDIQSTHLLQPSYNAFYQQKPPFQPCSSPSSSSHWQPAAQPGSFLSATARNPATFELEDAMNSIPANKPNMQATTTAELPSTPTPTAPVQLGDPRARTSAFRFPSGVASRVCSVLRLRTVQACWSLRVVNQKLHHWVSESSGHVATWVAMRVREVQVLQLL